VKKCFIELSNDSLSIIAPEIKPYPCSSHTLIDIITTYRHYHDRTCLCQQRSQRQHAKGAYRGYQALDLMPAERTLVPFGLAKSHVTGCGLPFAGTHTSTKWSFKLRSRVKRSVPVRFRNQHCSFMVEDESGGMSWE